MDARHLRKRGCYDEQALNVADVLVSMLRAPAGVEQGPHA